MLKCSSKNIIKARSNCFEDSFPLLKILKKHYWFYTYSILNYPTDHTNLIHMKVCLFRCWNVCPSIKLNYSTNLKRNLAYFFFEVQNILHLFSWWWRVETFKRCLAYCIYIASTCFKLNINCEYLRVKKWHVEQKAVTRFIDFICIKKN